MADIGLCVEAVQTGDVSKANGHITAFSGVLQDRPYRCATRFENSPGTNPVEWLAAAHAACYGMALASTLGGKGYQPERLETRATCVMSRQETGRVKITGIRLEVRGHVPGIDQATFEQIAAEVESECPVSNVMRPGLAIELHATLV